MLEGFGDMWHMREKDSQGRCPDFQPEQVGSSLGNIKSNRFNVLGNFVCLGDWLMMSSILYKLFLRKLNGDVQQVIIGTLRSGVQYRGREHQI